MDFDDTAEEAAFRGEARAWLEATAIAKGTPEDFTSGWGASDRSLDDQVRSEAVWVDRCKWWQSQLYAGGWAGITWPKAYGGRSGTHLEEAIFMEEQSRYGVTNGAFSVAIGMAGPTIIHHGTDEQKERWLDPMLRGDDVWCQLFSEPGAGSDLAGISTRAVRDGDCFVVNGQKVWTSNARESQWAILLARTDADLPKHKGISFLALDMTTPGIDIRPLRQMNGGYQFNEVFLDDVEIPAGNVLGEVNGGWRVAMTTLMSERGLIGTGGGTDIDDVIALAQRLGINHDPIVRQKLTRLVIRERAQRYLAFRTRTAMAHGRPLGPESSVAKLAQAIFRTDLYELATDLLGAYGVLAGDDAPDDGEWTNHILHARASRIGGGTDEIQRNVIAERVLGLPREPAPT